MKTIPPKTLKKLPGLAKEFLNQLEEARQANYHICYTDEVMFTRSTNSRHEFSSRGINIQRSAKNQDFPTTAVIATVSETKGLVHFKSFPDSINQFRYLEYLKELKKKVKDAQLVLVHDHLAVHHTKTVQRYLNKQGIR